MEVQIFGVKKSADTRKALRFFSERRVRAHFVDLLERAMSDGERHNIELELRKRFVRRMAGRFNALARDKQIERCLLATSKEIKAQFLKELDPPVRAKIEKLVPSDLTKLRSSAIMDHFQEARRSTSQARFSLLR